jgi:hypothetical protein
MALCVKVVLRQSRYRILAYGRAGVNERKNMMSSMRKMMENGDGIALFRGVFSAADGLP